MARSSPRAGRTIRSAAGAVLIAGLEGPNLTAVEASWLKLIRPAGVILFRRNIETGAGTRALLEAAARAVSQGSQQPFLRAVDLEGGAVDRLRDILAPMPSAWAVAQTRDPGLFAAHGRWIAMEARLFGFNVTFAPVLDLRTPLSEAVLGGRAVSPAPGDVAQYAAAFLAGLAKGGVLGCGKHFPGLGSGAVDSHQSTPRIDRPFELLWKEDLWPYRQLGARLPMTMISHASYPKTRSGLEPASVSPYWTSRVLKQKIGFQGLVITDDMEMGGILSQRSLPEAVLGAVLAGAHLIEICRDPALVISAFETLIAEAEGSPAFAKRLLGAAAEGAKLRKKLLGGKTVTEKPGSASEKRAIAEIQRFTETVRLAAGKAMGAADASK